jgi:myo-inositol-1-phosphate synthase
MARSQVGVWFIGARGSVATTAIAGLVALRKNLVGTTGLVSELPYFGPLHLPGWSEFVVGGHDIRATTLVQTAEQLCGENRALDAELVGHCRRELVRIDRNIRPGTLFHVGSAIKNLADGRLKRRHEAPLEVVARIQTDLRDFLRRQRLDNMVVINLASTEPPVDERALPRHWSELERMLSQPRKLPLAASSLYAIAALDLGLPYINFTPSLGSQPAAICELALLRETCHMGRDGKTGETLLKSILAPMFAHRNLEVMSWVGHNIFGNLDGQVLKDPENKQSKLKCKDQLLAHVLGYQPQTHVSIEFIKSLGDWKTAWDHVHFRGFLNTPMTLQFTWQGCDSLLAAPLVLDLARFALCAKRLGERGGLRFLASFFKSPMGVKENAFIPQFQMLIDWAKGAELGRPMSGASSEFQVHGPATP